MLIYDDIAQVRGPGLSFYIIRDGEALYLIDGGFIGGMGLLNRELRRCGWDQFPVRGILLTHGHLDHTFNLHALQQKYKPWIAMPQLDQLHLQGCYPYTGAARVCGLLEQIGRLVLRYKPCKPDRWIGETEIFPLLGGLQAIHLPGHTIGHTGFYSPSRRLLFSGDLFASYALMTHPPFAILNTSEEHLRKSIAQVCAMDIDGVLPNHCDKAHPATHLARLRKCAENLI